MDVVLVDVGLVVLLIVELLLVELSRVPHLLEVNLELPEDVPQFPRLLYFTIQLLNVYVLLPLVVLINYFGNLQDPNQLKKFFNVLIPYYNLVALHAL